VGMAGPVIMRAAQGYAAQYLEHFLAQRGHFGPEPRPTPSPPRSPNSPGAPGQPGSARPFASSDGGTGSL
jgi:hypothetical protein